MSDMPGLFKKGFMKKVLFVISFLFFGTAIFASENSGEPRDQLLNIFGVKVSVHQGTSEKTKNAAKKSALKRRLSKESQDLFELRSQLSLKDESSDNYNLFRDGFSTNGESGDIKRIEIESPQKFIYLLARFESKEQKESYLDHGFSIRTIYKNGSIKIEQA